MAGPAHPVRGLGSTLGAATPDADHVVGAVLSLFEFCHQRADTGIGRWSVGFEERFKRRAGPFPLRRAECRRGECDTAFAMRGIVGDQFFNAFEVRGARFIGDQIVVTCEEIGMGVARPTRP